MQKEKVYITRDEDDPFRDDHFIYVWRKSDKGNWSPTQLEGCETVNWQREDIDNMDIYTVSDFKKKFGITIPQKIKKCTHLSSKLVNSEDYKLISDDPNRKQ